MTADEQKKENERFHRMLLERQKKIHEISRRNNFLRAVKEAEIRKDGEWAVYFYGPQEFDSFVPRDWSCGWAETVDTALIFQSLDAVQKYMEQNNYEYPWMAIPVYLAQRGLLSKAE